MATMQTIGLYKSLPGTEEQPIEPAAPFNAAINNERKNHNVLEDAYEKEVADINEKTRIVWCHLVLTAFFGQLFHKRTRVA